MLLIALILVSAAHAADNAANLTLLPDSTQGRCLDGTVSGFYHLPALPGPNTSKWVLNLQGGGECTTEKRCTEALSNALGSSKYFSPTFTFGGDFVNRNQQQNPLSWDWHLVQLPYCTQDLWTGTRVEPSNSSFGMPFTGHLVLESVVEALTALPHGLGEATEVILTGESAGGMGVTPNLGWLQSRLGPKVRVTGAPIAGLYYYADPYTGPGHTQSNLADFREPAWPQHAALWESHVEERCLQALGDVWRCILANYSQPFIQQPIFFTQSKSDQVVLTDHDWVPQALQPWSDVELYIHGWQANMTTALGAVRAVQEQGGPRRGFFGVACFIHTTFRPDAPLLPFQGHNVSFAQAFNAWYGGQDVFLQDGSVVFSNPTCPK